VDQPETLIEPETAVEEALAHVAERVVRLVSTPKIEEQGRFNVFELLTLYDFGLNHLKPAQRDRWKMCFAMAASTGGVWCAKVDGEVGYLGIFWRTKNINVNLEREIPKPDPSGNYVYLGYHWNESGLPLLLRFRDHMIRVSPGAEFIAGHDYRVKLRKSRRGRPWVLKIKAGEVAGERN